MDNLEKQVKLALSLVSNVPQLTNQSRALIYTGIVYPAAHLYLYGSEPSNLRQATARLPQYTQLNGRDCPAFLISLDNYTATMLSSNHFISTFVGDKI